MTKRTCFAVPIKTEHGDGIWYAEFTGSEAHRVFEVYANKVLVSNVNIMLPDQPFEIAATPDYYQHEISTEEFQAIWELRVLPTTK